MQDISSFSLLVDAALKGTLVLLAATVLALVLRRGSAAARHVIWQLAVIGILALPVVKAVSPLRLPVLPELRSPVVAAPIVANGQASAAASEQTAQSVTAPSPDASSPVRSLASSPPRQPPLLPRLLSWLAYAWVAVAAALLLRLALGFFLVRWFALRAYPLYEDGWAELKDELSGLMGLHREVQLFASPHIATPMTWGIMRPVIMLPSAAEDWSAERRRVVMLHELAHIRRKDSLTHMIAQLACAVYWFHPLVWKAAARMRAEAERASDDLVLHAGTKASVYADHLLELIRTIGGMRTPALALPMAQRSTFEGRLLAILEPHLDRTAPRPLSVAGMMVVVGLIVLPLAGLTTASGISTETASRDPVEAADADEPLGEIRSVEEMSTKAADEVAQELGKAKPTAQQDAARRAALGPLAIALRDEDANVRLAAAQSLGEFEDSAAVAALARALREDSDARVRKMAAWALGNIEADAGVPALVHALRNDRDLEVRRTAVWALGQIEDRSAVPALTQVLKDSDADTRRQAAWALGQIEDASAVPALAAALRDTDAEVREHAVWALGEIESPAAVSPLSSLADDASDKTRKQVAWALGQIEDESAVSVLGNMLRQDKNTDVRETAAWALGQIESTSAVPALSAALKDASASVRRQAAWALGQIEAQPAPQALIDALRDSDSDVRATALWALAQIEDPNAYSALAEMLKDPDPEVRRSAAAAIGGRDGGDPRPRPQPQPRPRPRPEPIR